MADDFQPVPLHELTAAAEEMRQARWKQMAEGHAARQAIIDKEAERAELAALEAP